MANRNTPKKANPFYRSEFTPQPSNTFEVGHMVAFLPLEGRVEPAAAVTASVGNFPSVVGVANQYQVSPTDSIEVDVGIFKFTNGDSITALNIGDPLFATNSTTVSKANTGLKPIAGECAGVDTDGVWVKILTPGEAAVLSGSVL